MDHLISKVVRVLGENGPAANQASQGALHPVAGYVGSDNDPTLDASHGNAISGCTFGVMVGVGYDSGVMRNSPRTFRPKVGGELHRLVVGRRLRLGPSDGHAIVQTSGTKRECIDLDV